jgi:HNH endonuclease
MQTRTCAECGRSYEPSSRHLRCPACRSRNSCRCGEPKQSKSTTCAECRTVVGASNGHWRDGRTRHKAGYVMLWAPDHPRAGRGQYVFEHILVMEQILGRQLLPEESVHHRNGVRDDNRPTNLETLDPPSANRHQGGRRYYLGARNTGSIYGGFVHLQQCSRHALSTLGGAGNRTRVLQYLTRASPGAACSAFLSPGDHTS